MSPGCVWFEWELCRGAGHSRLRVSLLHTVPRSRRSACLWGPFGLQPRPWISPGLHATDHRLHSSVCPRRGGGSCGTRGALTVEGEALGVVPVSVSTGRESRLSAELVPHPPGALGHPTALPRLPGSPAPTVTLSPAWARLWELVTLQVRDRAWAGPQRADA